MRKRFRIVADIVIALAERKMERGRLQFGQVARLGDFGDQGGHVFVPGLHLFDLDQRQSRRETVWIQVQRLLKAGFCFVEIAELHQQRALADVRHRGFVIKLQSLVIGCGGPFRITLLGVYTAEEAVHRGIVRGDFQGPFGDFLRGRQSIDLLQHPRGADVRFRVVRA